MPPYLIAGVIVGLPLLLVLALRIHASAFFISISAGYLLSVFISDTAGLISSSFVNGDGSILTAKLVVFLLPVIITIGFMRGTVPVRQMFLHTVPHICNSLLMFVLILPILPSNISSSVSTNPAGEILLQVTDVVVAVTVTSQILLMIITSHPARG